MVDFNSEATVSAAAIDILRILILQRRNDVIDSIEGYRKLEAHSEPEASVIRARLYSLFLEIQPMIKRKHDDYDDILKGCLSKEFNILTETFLLINEFLDKNRLIRIDMKEIYDSTRTSSEDKEKGLS